jgi:transmembrane sensor
MDATERRDRATAEASEWWHRLGTRTPATLSKSEREEFTQWLRESPLHVSEMLHMARVQDALERFELWKDIAHEDIAEPRAAVVRIDACRAPQEPPPPRRRVRLAWVASLVCVLAAAGWSMMHFRSQVIETDRAERREVMLNDGSIVRLEPETRLRIDFEKRERHVTLDRGRALFMVVHERNRPFLVEADSTLVRAIGTSFGVERKEKIIVVTGSEGKVAATDRRSDDGALDEVLLTAGKQLTVQRSGAEEHVRDVDASRALAWTEGRLVFDSAPLAEVAREFNRYNHLQLRILDPELARRSISGVFQASDLETLVAFIRTGAHVTVRYDSGEQIIVSPAP